MKGCEEVTTCSCESGSRIAFCIACKNEAGGKEVTERRSESEGKKKTHPKEKTTNVFFVFCTYLSLVVAVMTFCCMKTRILFLPCRVTACLEAISGDRFFLDHFATA